MYYNASAVHRNDVGGLAGGAIEVVQDRDDSAGLLVQFVQQVEHLDLVGDIEVAS
ncbi:hypothetical protein ACFVAV_30275 [Nocardia sp. NPDC057663]|uniref:hypothetical protein n=1 Tax=Nocardia sp. NPDC057663 TaxID=3346201 RepID=UPI00366C22E5